MAGMHVAAAMEASLEQREQEAHDESFLAPGIIPEAAAGENGKRRWRVSPDIVGSILAREIEVPTINHLDELADVFRPEWIEKRRQEHKKRVALYKKINDGMEFHKDKFRRELSEHGYVQVMEVDDGYLARRARLEASSKEQFAKSKKIEHIDSDFED